MSAQTAVGFRKQRNEKNPHKNDLKKTRYNKKTQKKDSINSIHDLKTWESSIAVSTLSPVSIPIRQLCANKNCVLVLVFNAPFTFRMRGIMARRLDRVQSPNQKKGSNPTTKKTQMCGIRRDP